MQELESAAELNTGPLMRWDLTGKRTESIVAQASCSHTYVVAFDIAISTRMKAADGTSMRSKNAVVIATGAVDWDDADSFSSGIIDRSPCGTGTCTLRTPQLFYHMQLGDLPHTPRLFITIRTR